MKSQRPGLIAGLVAVTLALGACGSDDEGSTGGGDATTGGNAAGIDCATGSLSAAGSSAQHRAYTAWIGAYQKACGDAAIDYDAQGSGSARTRFIQKRVPLAGSDSALTEQQKTDATARCAPGRAVHLPTVLTPIAVAYTLRGVDKLVLTPTVIGQIFDNKITDWSDPVIAKANPGVTLPSKSITPVHRGTDSSATETLTRFLAAQDRTAWPYDPAQAWPASGGRGASDSGAMVQQIKGTDGAVGYVDNPDAVNNDLDVAAIDTGSGAVELTKETVGTAIAAADVKEDSGDLVVSIDYGLMEEGAYPAVLATYQITCTGGLPAGQAKLVKSFLSYQISEAGQEVLDDNGYVPLPSELRDKVKAGIDALGAA